jgi:hypothetical protein
MSARSTYVLGARRRYWFALAFVVGYQMLLTDFTVAVPW